MLSRRDIEELAAKLRKGQDETFLAGLRGANLIGTDLRGANLTGAGLAGADLRGANLSGANLTRASLIRADLTAARLTEGTNLHRVDLTGADLHGADLRGADLSMSRLTEANLREARLAGADLRGANLRRANLTLASFTRADLTKVNLTEADLNGAGFADANLTDARLAGADLRAVNLLGTNLTRANLLGATLTRAELRGADLTGVNLAGADLISVTLLDNVQQAELRSANVDWTTVAKSLRIPDLLNILVRTGMPEVVAIYLIDSLRSIDEVDLFTMLQSVFLSYGTPDEDFAERLRNDLTRNGVTTWFFPKDAIAGARIHRHIHRQINEYDRMILCCSKASLLREGVLHEIEEVLEREQEEGGTEVLIPILLDPIFDTGRSPPPWWPDERAHIYRALRRRVSPDFRGALDNPDQWSEQLGRVLAALRKRPEQGTTT